MAISWRTEAVCERLEERGGRVLRHRVRLAVTLTRYSARIPAALITFSILAVSALIVAANS